VRESAAPDYAEPLLGWRVWLVVEAAGSLRLCSPLYHTLWPVRSETVAVCRKELPPSMWWPLRPPEHAAPSADCRCGIYASTSAADAARVGRAARAVRRGAAREALAVVLGQVSLWGGVVECERGWRAAYAYPARLYLPRDRLERSRLRAVDADSPVRVAEALGTYRVPVELVPCATMSELADTLARADAPPGSDEVDPALPGLAKALKRTHTLGKTKSLGKAKY
jgi:hypothetical protein